MIGFTTSVAKPIISPNAASTDKNIAPFVKVRRIAHKHQPPFSTQKFLVHITFMTKISIPSNYYIKSDNVNFSS
ncbi:MULTISPECIES: hypothetical protein [Enterococcus]|uniref:hypothetical protein n=1 Tax=Enterococcus TaxID=1350 RepID=UPI00046C4FC5|nr:hypothetical protein [Enterococcus faecalis]WOA46994.1 hypothetical protein RX143_02375 [Enterococcus faecalis]